MAKEATILIVGGNSRIGASLKSHFGSRANAVVRNEEPAAGFIGVSDYTQIPAEAFAGIERVVNCVGVSRGPAATMMRANVDVPVSLAAMALQHGIKQFIHVSSFSVYGRAAAIDRNTLEVPTKDYGKSKLAADQQLLALGKFSMDVAVLRLPLIYATGSMGKLGQLLRTWRTIGLLPIPRSDVRRAMIGVELVTQVMIELIERPPRAGVFFAADPAPFTYEGVASARRENLRIITLPDSAAKLISGLVPEIGDRLFADSTLASADNLAEIFALHSRIYQDIANANI